MPQCNHSIGGAMTAFVDLLRHRYTTFKTDREIRRIVEFLHQAAQEDGNAIKRWVNPDFRFSSTVQAIRSLHNCARNGNAFDTRMAAEMLLDGIEGDDEKAPEGYQKAQDPFHEHGKKVAERKKENPLHGTADADCAAMVDKLLETEADLIAKQEDKPGKRTKHRASNVANVANVAMTQATEAFCRSLVTADGKDLKQTTENAQPWEIERAMAEAFEEARDRKARQKSIGRGKSRPIRIVGTREIQDNRSAGSATVRTQEEAQTEFGQTSDDGMPMPNDDNDAITSAADALASIIVKRVFSEAGVDFESHAAPIIIMECGEEWTKFFENPCRKMGRMSYQRVDDTDTRGNATQRKRHLMDVIEDGRGVVISCLLPDFVPPLFMDAADYKVDAYPQLSDFRELMSLLGGDPKECDEVSIHWTGVQPVHLTLAWRHRDPSLFLYHLKTAANADRPTLEKVQPRTVFQSSKKDLVDFVDVSKAPDLESIEGMDEAVEHGMGLVRDILAMRAGKIGWGEVYGPKMVLSGPPGTGKTTFVRALAKKLKVPLLLGSYAIWLGRKEGHQGTLLEGMRKTFETAAAQEMCVVGIDEVDSFCDRDTDHHNKEWMRGVVNGLLQVTDQSYPGKIIVVGTCNDPTLLDPALVRAGRLEVHCRIGYPTAPQLASIMKQHLQKLAVEDLLPLARDAAGSTGADVDGWVRSAQRAARKRGDAVTVEDLRHAIFGEDNRTPQALLFSAIHESAHAVIGSLVFPGAVESVSIRTQQKSGMGGYTLFDKRHKEGVKDLQGYVTMLLAGRAAEQVIIGEVTGGCGGGKDSDLARATCLVVDSMAGQGMSDDVGLLYRTDRVQPKDLDRFLARHKDVAEAAKSYLQVSYMDTLRVVEQHRKTIVAVAKELAAKKSIEGRLVTEILKTHPTEKGTMAQIDAVMKDTLVN